MSRRRAAALAFVLALGLASGAGAWDWSGPADDPPLQAMLSHLPALMVQPGIARAEIGFADLAAARGIEPGGEARHPRALRVLMRALPPSRLGQELSLGGESWRGGVGFVPGDIAQLLLFDAPPIGASVMALNPGAAAAIPAALAANGYGEAQSFGVSAWTRGEDGRIDLNARSRDDPFRGLLGRSARIALDGDLLRHATTWPLLAGLVQADRAPATDDPGLAALLAALVPPAESGPLLRAYLLPDASGLASGLRSALLADYSTGPQSTALMVLAFDSAADLTAELVAQRWATVPGQAGDSYASRLGATPALAVQRAGDGLTLSLTLTLPTATLRHGGATNPAFDALYQAITRRDLVFLP